MTISGDLFFWAGLTVPALTGLIVMFVLRRRRVSTRKQAHATAFTMCWLLAMFMSVEDGRFDVTLFLVFLPYMSALAIGITEGSRWLDRKMGRGHLWK